MKGRMGSALVVGTGISGIRSALDLAERGYRVTMIDKAPHLGGVLTQLDYQFPTDHCGMCKMLPLVERDASSQYCLRKGLFHENIEILLSTELVGFEGEPGKFQVTLRQKPTLVDAERCIGCGACASVCPVEVPDRFNAGLTKRKAVYLPIPHNIPNTYVVDVASCTLCGECEKACPTQAIHLGTEARRKFKILIVDDERVVRDSLKAWLEDEGFQVETAESGPEALEKIAAGSFNLMLLDIKMPGMDGVEVLKKSKEARSELPVVMMTAYATVETAVEAMKLGAFDYLMKPFNPETLVPLVLQLYQNIERSGERRMEVGAVILAAGFESYDPATGKNLYGHGLFSNVVTSIEFERLLSGTGPNRGRLLRPSDGKPPSRVAWFQCVGSRDIQSDADFCSSACCMFAIKEALLAKEKTPERLEATIFYMDMRTFGKDFQRYRDRAEREQGVRFVRSRVHTLETVGEHGDLRVVHVDNTGEQHEEIYDMVVLSTGQRPPTAMDALADMTGVGLNPWGFCRTEAFSLTQTTREGVLAGGSVSGLKDISESVIQASSASLGAAKLIHSKGGSLMEVPEAGETPAFRDVSREIPRVLVALCRCGESLSERIPTNEIEQWLKTQTDVAGVEAMPHLCTREGWEALGKIAGETRANRILIGACMPYVYKRRLAELGEAAGLHPSLIEVVDILTPAVSRGHGEGTRGDQEVRGALAMGIGKLKGMDPLPTPSRRIVQKALVVGGGVAGMTAALAIAEQGYEVSLVEKEKDLGGQVRALKRTIEGHAPQEFLEGRIARVKKHPLIHLYPGAQVIHAVGHVGRFSTTIEKEDGVGETLEHGVTILATGAGEAKTVSYGYGQSPLIVTQHELEEKLALGTFQPENLKTVVMIQCVDSREEPRNYCSRICCASALKNALFLKEKNPETDVFILYRDIMSYGFLETFYTQARRAGVIFTQYRPEEKPEVSVEAGRPVVALLEQILGRRVILHPDLLVLSTGVVPNEVKNLAGIFGVPLDQDGFYQEAESKWRPVDFIKEGIFVCGTAHSPRSIPESVAMAEAAAQRALRILCRERLAAGSVVAEVRHTLCSLCERCIAACPYGARELDEEGEKVVVDELMCQGCGSCAAVCPNSASVLRGYKDRQVFDVIDAALETALAFEAEPA